jgi:hypothetical protein
VICNPVFIRTESAFEKFASAEIARAVRLMMNNHQKNDAAANREESKCE